MTASPSRETIAKIATIADESAAQDTLNFVMANVRANSHHQLDVAEAIYGKHRERHARSILIGALVMSYGAYNLDIVAILNNLRAIGYCHRADNEAQAEQWERIEDTARYQARECREYAGDEA